MTEIYEFLEDNNISETAWNNFIFWYWDMCNAFHAHDDELTIYREFRDQYFLTGARIFTMSPKVSYDGKEHTYYVM